MKSIFGDSAVTLSHSGGRRSARVNFPGRTGSERKGSTWQSKGLKCLSCALSPSQSVSLYL